MFENKAFFAVMIAMSVLLCGCLGGEEVSDRAFVQIMGIDKKENVYSVSLQAFSPSGSGQVNTENENSVCFSGKGSDLTSAISVCEGSAGRKLFLGHIKMIVLGEGIDDPAGELKKLSLINRGVLPLSCPVFYSDDPYKTASFKSKQGLYSAERLTDLIESSANLGDTFYKPVSSILRADLHPSGYAAVPKIYANEDEAVFEGAVVKSTKLNEMSLSQDELKGYIILSDGFKKGGRIIIEPAEITSSKAEIKAENSDGKLKINAKISLKVYIPPYCEDKHKTASEVCSAVRSFCGEAYADSAWEKGIDIFDIYSSVRKDCPEMLEGTDFSQLLRESSFFIQVSAKTV